MSNIYKKLKEWWMWYNYPQQELLYQTDLDSQKKWQDALKRARLRLEQQQEDSNE